MAEGNEYPAEEDFSYFCFDCRNAAEETEKDFFYVGALGPYYTCTQCGTEFDAGFKREKTFSSEVKISYICASCRNRTRDLNYNFIFVGSLGFCFACTQCSQRIDYGFKKEKRNSNDAPSHRCDVCGKTFELPYLLLWHSYDHSNEWPFRCLVCQTGFPTLAQLEKHKETFDIIRRFKCVKCLKIFLGKISCKLEYSPTKLYCENCASRPSPVEYVTS